MILNIGCNMTVVSQGTVPLVLMLRPLSGASQKVTASSVTIAPRPPTDEFIDSFGNSCMRATLEAGTSTITSMSSVEVPDMIDTAPGAPYTLAQFVPDQVLQYMLPSRYCQSDTFLKTATSIIGNALPGYDQANAICEWIRKNVSYTPGASDASTSAVETEQKRAGVCRDFAHLGIALCRALHIPARMVSGYLYQLDPMDLHAWFEAYVGDRWYTFDPTQNGPKGNRVVVAYGRDAADTAQVTSYGSVEFPAQNVWVNAAY